jgi:hypothetical protein
LDHWHCLGKPRRLSPLPQRELPLSSERPAG